ncbi:MAG: TonB-dependent receptor [Paludibacter sp.]
MYNLFQRQKWITLLVLLCFGLALQAQKKQIVGTVTDKTNEPLAGVTIKVKGTKDATITDFKGTYSIKASSNATLIFSFLGMETLEVPIENRIVVNASLEDKALQLNEAVAIGYGSVRRKDLTGSVGKVNMAEINTAPVTTIDQALAGRIAGVNIVAADASPGAQAQVTIRGGSLSQDASPLYVIDGFPMENFDLATLDSKNIESIDVLKDASSIAIYGSRGANGVIIINTKQGTVGKTKVDYSYNFSMTAKPAMPKMMGPYEYVKMQQEIASKEGSSQYTTFKKMYLNNEKGDSTTLENYRNEAGYNWPDLLMAASPTQTHSLSINGGTAETKYNFNLGYVDQKGVILNTGMNRYNAQFSLDQRFNKSVKLQLKATHNTIITKTNSVMNNLRQYRPTSGLGGQDLLLAEVDSMMLSGGNLDTGIDPSVLVSPLQQAQNEQDVRTQGTTTVNGKLELRFLKDFVFTTSVGSTFINTDREQFYNSKTIQGLLYKRVASATASATAINVNGVNALIDNQDVTNFLNENLLTYKKKFNKDHSLDVTIGLTYQYSGFKTQTLRAINMTPDFEYLGLYNLSSGNITTSGSGTQTGYNGSANQLLSYLGRVNYSYLDRYLFTVNFRADGSSKFYKPNQWGYFPSCAFAWRLSNEPFMNSLKDVVSDAKVRLSTGSVGNNRGVSDFSYLLELGQLQKFRSYTYDGVTLNNGLTQYFYSNENLTWEKTTEYNIGTDWSLFNDRITLTADYYRRVTSDFLMAKNIPYYAGYFNGANTNNNGNTRFENVGSVLNQGLELTIGATLIQTKDVNWSVNLNGSYNTNKVLEIAQGNDILTQNSSDISALWIAKKGGNISQFYGFMTDGLYQYGDFTQNPNGTYTLKPGVVRFNVLKNSALGIQPGDRKYKDLNGDGIIDDNDRTILGSPLPFLTGGISSTVSWKGFSLSAFFQYSYGSKVLNYNALKFGESGRYWVRGNMYESFVNRWTPDNTNTDIPRIQESIGGGDASVTTPRVTDKFIEDGSFIRFKTLSLSYIIPSKIVSKLKLSNISVNVSAQNLALWTKYSGQDPEVSNYSGVNQKRGTGYTEITNTTSYSSMTGGMDNAAYPRSLIVSGGINITF